MALFTNSKNNKLVIGLVHLLPLPGTPFYEEGNLEKSIEKALTDVRALQDGGADGCLIQTVDRVYPAGDTVDYARLAAFSVVVHEVAKIVKPDFQIGVQIMFNALSASVAVAKVCGGSFMRCAALVGSTLTGSGMIKANPYDFQKYRAYIGAQNIELVAEIDGMHFKWLGGRPTAEVARMALYVGASAVEIADADEDANNRKVLEVKKAFPTLPVILGGYTNHENVARRLAVADGAFVGTCFEREGWGKGIDKDLVREYVEIVSHIK